MYQRLRLRSPKLRQAVAVLPFGARIHRFLFFHIRPGEVTLDIKGLRITVDALDTVVGAQLIRDGEWEPYETALFLETIKSGMVVVDIGANIGYYTVLAARAVGSEGRVIAFEPDHRNFTLLTQNVEANGFSNRVTLLPVALSDHEGSLTLYRDDGNFGAHSLAEGNVIGTDQLAIPCARLDDVLEALEIGHVDVVKIDTQGAEGLVFTGAERVLSQEELWVFTEFWPSGLRRLGSEPEKLLQAFRSRYGFRVSRVDEEAEVVDDLATDDDMLTLAECLGQIDLVLMKP